MSDDWARNYIETHKQKQQEQQKRQKRAELAEAGGPNALHRIRERIRQDLHTFHQAGELLRLDLRKEDSPGKFRVSFSSQTAAATLDVELNIVLIKYEHVCMRKDGTLDHQPGTLRICADLEGNITVHKNGQGGAFADESEVSEFLLKPLLDYIDQ